MDEVHDLNFAIKICDIDMVKAAIAAGVPTTPETLALAINSYDINIVDAVIAAGAQMVPETLALAINVGNTDIVKMIIRAGALISSTILNLAIKTKNAEIVKALIAAGAPMTEDALKIAIDKHHETILFALEQRFALGAGVTPEILDLSIEVLRKDEIIKAVITAGTQMTNEDLNTTLNTFWNESVVTTFTDNGIQLTQQALDTAREEWVTKSMDFITSRIEHTKHTKEIIKSSEALSGFHYSRNHNFFSGLPTERVIEIASLLGSNPDIIEHDEEYYEIAYRNFG